ncbi:zinc-ribbon domain-containing protein [Roseibium algae]|uniref:Zinc-ribbon domain-containing protein n=1 Tax=Roseibium algae TaxID=3123038 RepID=A0ABU8TL67_9HYPH
MKIKCPDCSTSYEIKPEALGSEGRSVKCARCGNRWFVGLEPEAEEMDLKPAASADEESWAEDEADENAVTEETSFAAAAEESPAPRPTATNTTTPAAVEADDDGDDDAPIDIESMAKRPKITVNPNKFKRNRFGAILQWIMRRNFRRMGGLAFLIIAISLSGFVFLIRDNIVKQAPDLASLFEIIGFDVNLRGLEFRDLRTFHDVAEGKPVLVVEGSIRNIEDTTTPVPAVRLSIRGGDLQEIYSWTVEPRTKMLKALDETRFRTILADPPTDAADIQVRFIDRDKRQVVLE